MRHRGFVRFAPITECPCCEYDLRDHGASGRCPECGLEYSAIAFTVYPGTIIGRRWIIYQLVAYSASIVLLWWIGLELLAAVFAPGFLIMAYLWYSDFSHFTSGQVAFSEYGIVCYRSGRTLAQVPWEDVKNVRYSGGRIRGWALVAQMKNSVWIRVIPCGPVREDAVKALESIKILVKTHRKVYAQ